MLCGRLKDVECGVSIQCWRKSSSFPLLFVYIWMAGLLRRRFCVASVSRYPGILRMAWYGHGNGEGGYGSCSGIVQDRIASALGMGKLCAGLCEASLLRGFYLISYI